MSIDLRTACVAQWKMDETGGTFVADSSGNGNNGTSANTIASAAGKIGGAFSWGQPNDAIDTNSTFQSVFRNSFSIAMWAKPSHGTPPNDDAYFGAADEDTGSEIYLLHLTNGRFQFAYSEGEHKIVTTPAVVNSTILLSLYIIV